MTEAEFDSELSRLHSGHADNRASDHEQLAGQRQLRALITDAVGTELDTGNPAVLLDVLRAIDNYASLHPERTPPGRAWSRTDAVRAFGLLALVNDTVDDHSLTARRQRVADQIAIHIGRLREDRDLPRLRKAYREYLREKLSNPVARTEIVASARTLAADRTTEPTPPHLREPNKVSPPPSAASPVDDRPPVSPPARQRRLTTAIGALMAALVVAGSIAYIYNRNGGQPDGGTVVAATTLPAGAPDPMFPLSPDTRCNSLEATSVKLPDVEICVVYWCLGSLYTAESTTAAVGRGQIKLRPRIINNSAHAIDISIERPAAFRLLVSTSAPYEEWWKPPPATAAQGDRPIVVNYQGQNYWAIPPNVHRDAVPLTLPDGRRTYDGFATSWEDAELPPGQTAFKPLSKDASGRPIQEGNLVFDVPKGENVGLKGFALVDRGDPTRIIDFTDSKVWPAPSDLNSF